MVVYVYWIVKKYFKHFQGEQNMETYIFTKSSNFTTRGYNLRIIVYRMINNAPIYVGEEQVNTASYYGDEPTAYQIISAKVGYRMKDRYSLVKKVKLYNI